MSKRSNVHFEGRERRLSTSSSQTNMNGYSGNKSPTSSNGAKSPVRSGGKQQDRPNVGRTETTASGWATEDEEEKVSPPTTPHHASYGRDAEAAVAFRLPDVDGTTCMLLPEHAVLTFLAPQ